MFLLTVGLGAAWGAETGPEPADVLPPAPAGQAWKLAWHDEFDGTALDAAKWIAPDCVRRDGRWTPKAVALDGHGHLVIRTYEEGGRYFDGAAQTKGKYEHAFGYYVARMKLQAQPGHWCAFWMTGEGTGTVGDGGMDGTEIDIMEKPWLDGRVNHALHWDGYRKGEHQSVGTRSDVPAVMQGWHTYGLLWTPEEYVFYIDGAEKWRSRAGGVCQVPRFLEFSDELQKKGWAGDIRTAKLPDEFSADYVRVYDLVDAQGRPAMQPKPRAEWPAALARAGAAKKDGKGAGQP